MITCKLENGHTHNFRHVTVDAIIIQDEKILLIKRSDDYHIERGKYALPGGFLEFDETAVEAVLRETLEETGYQPISANLFKIVHSPRLRGDDRQNVGFFFKVKVGKKIQQSDDEVHSVEWVDLKSLDKYDIGFDHADHIRDYLTKKDDSVWPIIA